jgi:hypothetical protein
LRDFRPDICTNLGVYRGIVEDPNRIEALNMILNELEALGFDKLVQNFSTQHDPERASDILFEISIGQLLRRHPDIQDLQVQILRARSAFPLRIWSYCPTLPLAASPGLSLRVPRKVEPAIRHLAAHHQPPLRSIRVASERDLRLPTR